jgi:hypothetical protein
MGSTILNGSYAAGSGSVYSAPFDDFTPNRTANIGSVTWQGYYCNTAFTGNEIPDPVATAFVIRIAPNEAGANRPAFGTFGATQTTGTIQVSTVAAAAVTQRLEFTRQDAGCNARNEGDPAAYYDFSANLPSPYAVTAGTRYWMSIHAVLPAGRVAWHWRFGRQDNSFSIFWIEGTLTTFFADRAFALQTGG